MRTRKTRILAHIYRIMRWFGLTAEDIKTYAAQREQSSSSEKPKVNENEAFDLLCIVNGAKVRLSFSLRHMGEPIGIFPFKDEPEYLELIEYHGTTHANANPKHLPSVKFFERIYPIKDRLNKCLQELNEPILKGFYLADNSHMPGCGWIVGFDANNAGLSSDFYGGKRAANLRYIGRFDS